MGLECSQYIIAMIRELRGKSKDKPPGLSMYRLQKKVVEDGKYLFVEFDLAIRELMDSNRIVIISTVIRTGRWARVSFVARCLSKDIPPNHDFCNPPYMDYGGNVITHQFESLSDRYRYDTVKLPRTSTHVYIVDDGLPKRAKQALGARIMDKSMASRCGQ